MSRREPPLNRKPLLSVLETAIMLGQSQSSIYRSIERGDLPIPVFKIAGRYRIPRLAVDRLLAGEPPPSAVSTGPRPPGTSDRAS
jgi:hypothetical protein